MKRFVHSMLAAGVLAFGSSAHALPEDMEFYKFGRGHLFAGASVAYNTFDNFEDAIGGQVFFGADFFRYKKLLVAAEAGVLHTGTFESERSSFSFSETGAYLNLLAKYPLTPMIYAQGRAGWNGVSGIGGGRAIGAGVGFRVLPHIAVLTEIAQFGSVDSLRVGLVIDF